MTEDLTLPRHLALVHAAVRPVVERFRRRLDQPVAMTAGLTDIDSLIGQHLDRIGTDVARLTEEINGQFGPVVADPDSSEADVLRGAARLDVRLEQILQSYEELLGLDADDADFRGWFLLREVYRETLAQIQWWLDEWIDFLENPTDELNRRGLGYDDKVDVTFALTLSCEEQLDELTQWIERRADQLVPIGRPGTDLPDAAFRDREVSQAQEVAVRDRSLLTAFLAFAFGWMIGGG